MPVTAKMAFSIDFTPTPLILVADLEKFGLDIRSYRVPLKRSIQQVIAPSVRDNFDQGGRPDAWAPLSEETIQTRVNLGFSPDEILVRTGALRRVAQQLNIWTITPDRAYVADLPNKVWYGALHQSGNTSTRLPAREFLILQDEDQDKIQEVFAAWIEERMAARGWNKPVTI